MFSDGLVAEITNCTFCSNRASNGGAIQIKAVSHNNKNLLVVQNCTFSKNSASSSGGALYLEGSSINISTSKLSGNMGSSGSALYFSGTLKALTMTHCNVSENHEVTDILDSYLVQVIVVLGSSRVVASDVKFYNNKGAVLILDDTNVEIYNCLFNNNTAHQSYILVAGGASSLLLITDTSFIRNKATFSTLMLGNYITLIQKCRFEANGMNNTSPAITIDQDMIDLRLSGITFTEPTFQSGSPFNTVVKKFPDGSNSVVQVSLFYWNVSFIQFGSNETLHFDTMFVPNVSIAKLLAIDSTNCTEKYSPFASGKCLFQKFYDQKHQVKWQLLGRQIGYCCSNQFSGVITCYLCSGPFALPEWLLLLLFFQGRCQHCQL